MPTKATWDQRIDALTDQIKDKDIKTILKISSSNKMYPKDCITNGALELLVRKIIELEAHSEPRHELD